MKPISITFNPTNFRVKCNNKYFEKYVKVLCSDLVSLKMEFDKIRKRVIQVPDKEFYYIENDEYSFPPSAVNRLLVQLGSSEGLELKDLDIKFNYENKGKEAKLKFRENLIPRDYQEAYIEELTKNPTDIKLVDLQTGKGKTFIAMNAICRINKKVAIIILAMYIPKWIEDIKKYTYTKEDRIYIIKGLKSWLELMEMTDKELEKYDYFIFSTITLTLIFDAHTENAYKYSLREMFNRLGIGVVLSDETHQHYHIFFKAMMVFDVPKIIALSATLDSSDKRQRFLFYTLFPKKDRISNIIKYDKYIDLIIYNYRLRNPNKIKHLTNQGYSQIMFEQNIMKFMTYLIDYKNMILQIIKEDYIARRKKGEKILIFCGTVAMCKYLKQQAKKEFHKEKLDIRTYLMENEYSDIMEADICFSTVISSGTAIDIPNLITVIQTSIIGSLQQNIQALGRLRRIPDRDTRYYLLVCDNLERQRLIHRKRMNIIRSLVQSVSEKYYRKSNLNMVLG